MPNITFRQIESSEIRASEKERVITFVASDGTRDSAGTVLNVKGWNLDRFNKNGVVGYQHKVYGGWDDTDNPDNVIGKGYAYVKDDKLMVDVEFEPADINELAEKIYKKLLFGSLKAVSVGFVPVGKGQWGKGEEDVGGSNPTYYYAGQELLEVSVVNIPANPNALKKSYIAEAIEAEQEELRAQSEEQTEEIVPEPQSEEEPAPEEDQARIAAASELRKAELLARAALL